MTRALPFLLVAFAAAAPVTRARASTHVVHADSLSIRRDAEKRVSTFLTQWRDAWKRSDTERMKLPAFAITRVTRNAYLHCHARTSRDPSSGRADSFANLVRDQYEAILSARGLFAKCPTWIIGDRTSDVDEADSLDVALLPLFTADIVRERTRLIATLDSLQSLVSADGWLTGQRVRFRIDQRDFAGASRVVATCAESSAWCASLAAYVAWTRNDTHTADSLFARALVRMDSTQRCEWLDIAPLIPESDREAYSKRPCAERVVLAERYFWLADPLLADSVNERRLEHLARRVMIRLHADVVQDERYLFDDRRGGDAVVASLLRYGWPSTAMWTGREEESGHSGYLNGAGRAAPPYSTAEYEPGRVHYAPTWRAVMQPARAQSADWQLHSPVGLWAVFNEAGDFWWPVEHMRDRRRAMAQLPEPGQIAFWPRQHAVRAAAILDIAADASADVKAFVGHPVAARLVTSWAPANFIVISHADAPLGATLLLHGSFTPPDSVDATRDALLGVELESSSNANATARTRLGITTPRTLDRLPDGEIALSDPVLFTAPRSRALPSVVDSVIPRLRPNTLLGADRTIGVFWECYGLDAGDSVRVSVRVVPVSEPGLLRRMLSAVKLAADGATTITVAWREAPGVSADRANATEPAVNRTSTDRSITPRSIILDLAGATSGEYWLEVAATTANGRTASAHRRITVR